MEKPEAIRIAIEQKCHELGVKGFLLLYVDGNSLKSTGSLPIETLTPVLMPMLSEWFKKKVS